MSRSFSNSVFGLRLDLLQLNSQQFITSFIIKRYNHRTMWTVNFIKCCHFYHSVNLLKILAIAYSSFWEGQFLVYLCWFLTKISLPNQTLCHPKSNIFMTIQISSKNNCVCVILMTMYALKYATTIDAYLFLLSKILSNALLNLHKLSCTKSYSAIFYFHQY